MNNKPTTRKAVPKNFDIYWSNYIKEKNKLKNAQNDKKGE